MTEAETKAAGTPGRDTEFRSWHTMGEVNLVDYVGDLAAFLLSDDAAAINGAEIIADQGLSARLGVI